uniref:T26-8p n=1 Tax=Thermococcus sp. 26/2 TaxID=758583 RepID=D6MY31_9EURY|nr:t26-8p [Thermococcus sp. 26/2]
MIGRIAAALIAYLLCIFHFNDAMTTVGHLFGLNGFWALFIPSALIGLSVYRIADPDTWGLWDAVGFLIIGGIVMLAMTGNPEATAYEMVKGVVGFSVAAILGALTLRGGRDYGR